MRAGGSLLVAGDFSDYGVVARNHLASYDVATGALDLGFDPSPDGDFVHILKGSADGSRSSSAAPSRRSAASPDATSPSCR